MYFKISQRILESTDKGQLLTGNLSKRLYRVKNRTCQFDILPTTVHQQYVWENKSFSINCTRMISYIFVTIARHFSIDKRR